MSAQIIGLKLVGIEYNMLFTWKMIWTIYIIPNINALISIFYDSQ